MTTAYKRPQDRGSFMFGRTPLVPCPPELWGELRPVGVIRDGTSYNGNQLFRSFRDRHMHFIDLAVAGPYMVAAYWNGVAVWDVSGLPAREVAIFEASALPNPPLLNETDQHVKCCAISEDGTVIALGGSGNVGLCLFSFAEGVLTLLHQDPALNVLDLHIESVAGGHNAYVATPDGLFSCVIDRFPKPPDTGLMPHIPQADWSKRLVSPRPTNYLHGFGGIVIASSGEFSGGVVIYSTLGEFTLPGRGFGVAAWDNFFAVRREGSVEIYRGGPAPLLLSDTDARQLPGTRGHLPLQFSRSGGRNFLYVGHVSPGSAAPGQNAEMLLDVTDPANPRDVTPTGKYTDVDTVVPGSSLSRRVGYWDWYSDDGQRGHSWAGGVAGAFVGPYFVHSALSFVDVHLLSDGGPVTPLPEPPPRPDSPPPTTPPTPQPQTPEPPPTSGGGIGDWTKPTEPQPPVPTPPPPPPQEPPVPPKPPTPPAPTPVDEALKDAWIQVGFALDKFPADKWNKNQIARVRRALRVLVERFKG